MKNNLLLLFALFIFTACQQEKATTPPNEILNEVLAAQDASGLQAKYGQENVALDTSWVIGDDTLRGSILFPNSPKQAFIYYHEGKIADVTIQGESSAWKTASGLYLGMRLADVQKSIPKTSRFPDSIGRMEAQSFRGKEENWPVIVP